MKSVLTWILLLCLSANVSADTVGKWGRHATSLENPSWEGNPFDVELRGVYTSPSGRILKQWGFYAGENSWRVYFMPDETGTWTFKTDSPDPELHGKTGTFTCVASALPGKLEPHGKHWRLSDGQTEAPVIWNPPTHDGAHWAFRTRPADDPSVVEAIAFARDIVGARVMGIHDLFVSPRGWAKEWPADAAPYVVGREGEEFHLPFWDHLNDKLDAVRDAGMGHYIMFFTDDELTPDRFGMTPKSPAELRYFRYAVARLACYPIVLWDTGIDIGEYRSDTWCTWFCEWFNENDPWGHPTCSRSGGGSGGILPPSATYFSTGGAALPSREELLTFQEASIPIAHTDHWRPFIRRGDWNNDKIRTAMWRCALTGGQAAFPDYNQGPVDYDQVKIGAAYIGHATRFFRKELQLDLGELRPHDELIVAGENAILAGLPGKEYVVYDLDGGTLVLNFGSNIKTLRARWYNPRNGEVHAWVEFQSGTNTIFESPSSGENKDWVLQVVAPN